jgi:MFS family permease
MWRLGFFFHEMGFGLLSIFLPVYVVYIAPGNGLFYIGIMSALAVFSAIPASFFWGYLCDKTRHYKRFILLSFLASTAFLYFFTLTTDVGLLIVLYAVMTTLHVAHEPPKNVLIAELYSREDWEKNFAFYEGFTEVGSLIGLLLGFFMSTFGLGPINTLLVCSGLNLVAFVLSLMLVGDPPLIFERRLVGIEKTIDFASRGVFLASRILDGMSVREKLKRENVTAFCVGLVLFSLATSILFTPMPIFISNITKAALLPAGLVFAIYVLNSGGGVAGYALARIRSTRSTGKANLGRIVMFRSVLAFLLIAVLQISASVAVGLATMILILMGFAYAIFLVSTLSLSMELIPAGKAGLFNVLIGIGGALGSFIGPFIAQASGFFNVFIIAGVIFFSAYVAFKIFS